MNTHRLKTLVLCTLVYSGIAITHAKSVWVSDQLEAPLRDKPELSAKIISMLPAGKEITKVSENNDYTKIKTDDGTTGWLSNYYILNTSSTHAQLAPLQTELKKLRKAVAQLSDKNSAQAQTITQLSSEKNQLSETSTRYTEQFKASASNVEQLTAENTLLQKKLSEHTSKIEELAQALGAANEEARNAKTQYFSLVKVSKNAVAIDKQSRKLQQENVVAEQTIQQLKSENQELSSQLNTRQTLVTALLIFGGIFVGYILSVIMPRHGRSSSSYPSL